MCEKAEEGSWWVKPVGGKHRRPGEKTLPGGGQETWPVDLTTLSSLLICEPEISCWVYIRKVHLTIHSVLQHQIQERKNNGLCITRQVSALCLNSLIHKMGLAKVPTLILTQVWGRVLRLFSHSVASNSVTQGLQHTRLPCPSLSPGVCPNSCPLSY